MRYLFLTYGAPGSGKSTFIQNNHLEKYTVATDNVRELAGSFQTRLEADELNGYAIASANETFVWQTVYKMVEHRMQAGITTFVDLITFIRILVDRV
ncbi:AAA family ATPase [Ligilactobacillus saerimneri]|uniref:AAA family ATPase n=1 Tax=Ligilactobacillus saerimneri TaxID=228229 RepID=UPI001E1A7143|nr:AAA family ATPase [Ligilactobacillus saerimneri]HJF29545.1 AAA family ATPase [Ligilactobacillus saerimneri]